MKNLENHEVRSHNKVRTLFAENKVRSAGAEQLY